MDRAPSYGVNVRVGSGPAAAESLRLSSQPVTIFDKLESCDGIQLGDRKRAWYAKKIETQLQDMKREYPSTPEEAFEASIEGAYYAEQMAQAELQGRVGPFKALPELPVHTAWDIGVGHSTAIWFWQKPAGKIYLCGYFEASGEGLPYYVDMLDQYRRRLGWTYGRHFVPQDARVREWGSGKTRIEELFAAGIRPSLVPPHSMEDGINAVRHTLPHCWFAEDECSTGIRHLKHYRKDWDGDRGVWKDKPRHDSSSHAADAFRYLSMAWREVSPDPVAPPTPKEIIREMCKPRTIGDMWREFADDRREHDEELPEDFEDFNLNKPNTMEMK